MNSLVVFLSVMALAAASPTSLWCAPEVLSYSAPAIAVGPSAVSHQSRVDIKSSPAIVSETITPLSRAVVAESAGAVVAAPAAYAAPLAYSAHAALAAPVAVAPSAVSHQSRIDIKTSPAVISTVASTPVLRAGLAAAPIAYGAQFSSLYAPSAVAAVAPTVFRSGVIRPISVAAPAVAAPLASAVLPVAPAETPEVVAARIAHLEAKARIESDPHCIHKRSAQFVAPVISPYSAPVVSTYGASPLVYSSPVAHVSAFGVPSTYVTRVL